MLKHLKRKLTIRKTEACSAKTLNSMMSQSSAALDDGSDSSPMRQPISSIDKSASAKANSPKANNMHASVPLKCYQRFQTSQDLARILINHHNRTPEYSGELRRFIPKTNSWKKQIFELRDHFLFYYSSKKAKLPEGNYNSSIYPHITQYRGSFSRWLFYRGQG